MNFLVADRVRLAYRIDGPDDARHLCCYQAW